MAKQHIVYHTSMARTRNRTVKFSWRKFPVPAIPKNGIQICLISITFCDFYEFFC